MTIPPRPPLPDPGVVLGETTAKTPFLLRWLIRRAMKKAGVPA